MTNSFFLIHSQGVYCQYLLRMGSEKIKSQISLYSKILAEIKLYSVSKVAVLLNMIKFI